MLCFKYWRYLLIYFAFWFSFCQISIDAIAKDFLIKGIVIDVDYQPRKNFFLLVRNAKGQEQFILTDDKSGQFTFSEYIGWAEGGISLYYKDGWAEGRIEIDEKSLRDNTPIIVKLTSSLDSNDVRRRIRVSYIDLIGLDASIFGSGYIPLSIQNHFNINPELINILSTSPLRSFQDLLNRYGTPDLDAYNMPSGSVANLNKTESDAKNQLDYLVKSVGNKKIDVVWEGDLGYHVDKRLNYRRILGSEDYRNLSIFIPDLKAAKDIEGGMFPQGYSIIKGLNCNDEVYIEGKGGNIFIGFSGLQRYLKRDDITNYKSKMSKVPINSDDDGLTKLKSKYWDGSLPYLLEYISRDGLPKDFMVVDVKYPIMHTRRGLAFDSEFPEVGLRVLFLENISSNPIRLEEFFYKKDVQKKLRKESEFETNIVKANTKFDRLFPIELLKPKGIIAIPIQFFFTHLPDFFLQRFIEAIISDQNMYKKGEFKTNELQKKKVKFVQSYANCLKELFQEFGEERILSDYISFESDFSKMLNFSDPVIPGRKFLYGPALVIESIIVDNKKYEVRDPYFARSVQRSSIDAGSCPTVFSYDTKSGIWITEGRILKAASSKKRIKSDTIRLSHPSNIIRVDEKEGEITYLYEVELIVNFKSHSEILKPLSWPKNTENSVIILRPYERIDLNFPISRDKILSASTVYLKTLGYYNMINLANLDPK